MMVKVNYSGKRFRGNMSVMAGNYADYNLKSEPAWAKFIYEANVGVKLSQKSNLWLDAGVLPSHIGFENAISADCWTLTRSILAENSPYYETGVKLSYVSANEKLGMSLLVLNGWQRIRFPEYRQLPSLGMQVTAKITEKFALNYSNFIGTDKPDIMKSLRIFHNAYIQYDRTKKIGFIAGFDIGTDNYNLIDYGTWFSPVVIVRWVINNNIRLAFRMEYYNDKHEIIVSTPTGNGFDLSGLSANMDYQLTKQIAFRIEGKYYHSTGIIANSGVRQQYLFNSNLTIRL